MISLSLYAIIGIPGESLIAHTGITCVPLSLGREETAHKGDRYRTPQILLENKEERDAMPGLSKCWRLRFWPSQTGLGPGQGPAGRLTHAIEISTIITPIF